MGKTSQASARESTARGPGDEVRIDGVKIVKKLAPEVGSLKHAMGTSTSRSRRHTGEMADDELLETGGLGSKQEIGRHDNPENNGCGASQGGNKTIT